MKKKFFLLFMCALLILPMFASTAEAREFGQWESKFGFQGKVGNATYLDDGAIMEGFGGAWYSNPVKEQVGIKFQLNKKVDNYACIFALLNKPNVGWNLNGKEAQGIIVQVRSWVDGRGVSATVLKATGKGEKGIENLGAINSMVAPMNTDHFLGIYKQGANWRVALDGGQYIEITPEDMNFGSQMYVASGMSYNETDDYARAKELQMSIHAVYVDKEMPASYIGDGEMAGKAKEPVVAGWQRVRGYGMNNADNGKALAVVDGKLVMEGYGGCAYTGKEIHDAVAVDFELNEYNLKKTYYFSFGLVNKEKAYYNPNGKESQGITVRITSFQNGQGLNMEVWYVSQAGTENLGSIRTTVASKNTKHNIAFFKEDGKWYVGIDGQQKLRIDLDVELGEQSYLCAGASAYKELKMSILNVYADGEVTDKMKEGTVKASSVATGASGQEYGPGGTSFSFKNFAGELKTAAETGTLGHLISNMVKSMAWYQWVLVLAVVAGITGTVFVAFKERKKQKK